MGDVIPTGSPRQGELPVEYRDASEEELDARIRAAKATLGDRVVILGHFYQREEVVRHADYVGDSFQLANAAKARSDAEAIVFCGVHFMAETADLLSTPEQAVILPNLAAGCSMADMANIDQVEECWEQLEEVFGPLDAPGPDGLVPVIPVTYMNSVGATQGLLRAPRRHRLHVVERRRPCSSGRSSAASACCSSPTSTSDATRRRRWACRSSRCRCGTRTSRSAATTAATSRTAASSSGTASARCTAASRSTRSRRRARSTPACA